MKKKRYYTGLITTTIVTCGVYGQSTINTDSLKMLEGDHLQEVQVMAHGHQHAKTRGLANTDLIGSGDLLRAACCNLGESFTTNPSVDVVRFRDGMNQLLKKQILKYGIRVY